MIVTVGFVVLIVWFAMVIPVTFMFSVQVTVHVPFTPEPSFAVAVITVVPALTYVTTPLALTVATPGLLLLHVTPLFVALLGVIVGVIVTVGFVVPVFVNVLLASVIPVTFILPD